MQILVCNYANMNTDSFIVCKKSKIEGIYTDVPKEVETRFDTSSYKLGHYAEDKNRNVTELIKDELDEKIMTKIVWLKQIP